MIDKPQFKDGPYRESDIKSLIYDYSDFNNESELQAHVVKYLGEILEDRIISSHTEYVLPPNQPRQRSKFRVDIVVEGAVDHYLIECKVPKYNGVVELIAGIAQLQLYSLVYEKCVGVRPKLILIADSINAFVTTYIDKFAPNVGLIIVGKDYHLNLEYGSHGQ